MENKGVDRYLWGFLAVLIAISVAFAFYRYIVRHDYEILFLDEEGIEAFLEENAEEEGSDEVPEEGAVEETDSMDDSSLENVSASTTDEELEPEAGLESDE